MEGEQEEELKTGQSNAKLKEKNKKQTKVYVFENEYFINMKT